MERRIDTGIYQYVFQKWVEKEKTGRFSGKIYCELLKRENPVIKYKMNHQDCYMPFSHMCAFYKRRFPLYDRQLGFICTYVKKLLDRSLGVIDVGANIGDTVLNIGDAENRYLCVEGMEEFADIAEMNLRKRYCYKLIRCFAGEQEKGSTQNIREGGGICKRWNGPDNRRGNGTAYTDAGPDYGRCRFLCRYFKNRYGRV